MKNKKYELTNETIEFEGRTLHRIRALKNFSNVKRGQIGGYIESEDNLSHEGDCWVYDEAKVFDSAIVYGNASIFENGKVYDNAKIFENATVIGVVCEQAKILDKGVVSAKGVVGGKNILKGHIYSKVVNYIEIQNPEGRLVTCVLKKGKLLFNVGCQEEITEETFIDRIYNEDGGIEKNPHRKYYLTIIKMANLWADDILNEK